MCEIECANDTYFCGPTHKYHFVVDDHLTYYASNNIITHDCKVFLRIQY